jgi:hypothetical protein
VKKVKLSQWHGANVKPVHIGVYETMFEPVFKTYGSGYSLWNGKFWTYQNTELLYESDFCGVGDQKKKWRGIVK